MRLEREVFLILLQREGAAIQILMRNDRGVEQRGRVFRLRAQRRVKLLAGLLVTPTLCLHEAQAVPRFGRTRVEFDRLAKIFFSRVELVRAQLGRAQFDPTVERIGPKAGVTGEFRLGGGNVVLFKVKAAEVVVRGGEVPVKRQRLLVGFGGVFRPPRAMVGETQVIPCSRVPGQQSRGLLQLLNSPGVIAIAQEAFALQQRRWTRLGASVEQDQAENRQSQRRKRSDRLFDGHHQARW